MTRLERRILIALAVAALAPLVAALILGRGALGDAYRRGINDDVRGQLEQAVDGYRERIVALRERSDSTTDAIAQHWALHAALRAGAHQELGRHLEQALDRYPTVGAITVTDAAGDELAAAERQERLDPQRVRTLARHRRLEAVPGLPEVEVIVTAPVEAFEQFQRAGEVSEVYSRLYSSRTYVAEVYVWVYIAFLLVAIIAALLVSVVLARRVTRRVLSLAAATERVGRGDLDVEVPADDEDEIGELTMAFNTMVRDLRESRERIDYLQRIGAWQEFARRLAHEIKNPLTPIQLAAQEMSERYDGDDAAFKQRLLDARSIIEEEVHTLRRLVTEFSSFAKLPQADLTDADLRELLHDLERGVPAILEDVGDGDGGRAPVEVTFEVPNKPVLVQVDGMMLKRCLDNLVRNAVQALRDAGGEGRVRVSLTLTPGEAGESAHIRVDDDGPGIEAPDRARVFDPYFTTKTDGTGLGLAIVKKVVLEHDGAIRCDASEMGGARFEIALPIRRVLDRRAAR